MSWIKTALNKNRTTIFHICAYVAIAAIVSLVLFWRFPNSVLYPNFYGEDGSVLWQNVINHGWPRASITPFNGYSIVGLYVLCGFGWVINLFFGGSMLTLPTAFALVAILFMGAVIALPYLLFKKRYGSPKMLVVVAMGALMPLPLSPHIAIGNIGNQKWIFFYLAFLLVLYRVLNHKKLSLPKLIAIDATLLLSAYTNSTTYALVPVLLAPYVKDWWVLRKKHQDSWLKLRSMLTEQSMLSLITLGVLMVPQILYVALRGIPKMPGYLDGPFVPDRAIEVFVNRTYLFGITHAVNWALHNSVALILFAILVFIGIKRLKGFDKLVFVSGLYAAGVASILFVLNRPGVSDFFFHYRAAGSGPDQFFYAQTLIMYLPIALVIFSLTFKLKKLPKQLIPALLIMFIILSGLLSSATFGQAWRDASPYENDAGIFTDQALKSCNETPNSQSSVRITVYPYVDGRFAITVPREQICNTLLDKYQLSAIDLGLRVQNNDYLALTDSVRFTQQFTAPENHLDGLRIFLSDFAKNNRTGDYQLLLYSQSCTGTPIRTATLPTITFDNSYSNIRFNPVDDSGNKQYCFTIQPPKSPHDYIALQRSQAGAYPEGVLTENGVRKTQNIVFLPLFSSHK